MRMKEYFVTAPRRSGQHAIQSWIAMSHPDRSVKIVHNVSMTNGTLEEEYVPDKMMEKITNDLGEAQCFMVTAEDIDTRDMEFFSKTSGQTNPTFVPIVRSFPNMLASRLGYLKVINGILRNSTKESLKANGLSPKSNPTSSAARFAPPM